MEINTPSEHTHDKGGENYSNSMTINFGGQTCVGVWLILWACTSSEKILKGAVQDFSKRFRVTKVLKGTAASKC